MMIRQRWTAIAARMDRPVQLISVLVLALMFALVFVSTREALATPHHRRRGRPDLQCPEAGGGLRHFAGSETWQTPSYRDCVRGGNPQRCLGNPDRPVATLAGNPTMAIPPMIYGLPMVITAVGFGVLVTGTRRPA
jgi:hypothetical protein